MKLVTISVLSATGLFGAADSIVEDTNIRPVRVEFCAGPICIEHGQANFFNIYLGQQTQLALTIEGKTGHTLKLKL